MGKKGKNIGGQIYEVEKILRKSMKGRKAFYYIKWRGFPDAHNTWEPEENLVDVPDALENDKAGLEQNNEKGQNRFHDSSTGSSVSISFTEDELKNPTPKIAKMILAVTDANAEKKLMFLVRYEDGTAALVDRFIAHSEFPQLVIAFYEKRIKWHKDESTA